jgi:hypothetical protein
MMKIIKIIPYIPIVGLYALVVDDVIEAVPGSAQWVIISAIQSASIILGLVWTIN